MTTHMKALLEGGPADGRELEMAKEVPRELEVDGSRYILHYVDDRRGVLHYRFSTAASASKWP